MLLDNRECRVPNIPHSDEDRTVDDDVINMEPQCKPRPRYKLLLVTHKKLLSR